MEPTDKSLNANAAGGNGHAETKRRAHDTVERAARGAHDTVDRIADAATRATSSLGEKGEQLSETGERLMAQTRSYAQTHPVATIGIAVAAGFLLSRLLRSDHH